MFLRLRYALAFSALALAAQDLLIVHKNANSVGFYRADTGAKLVTLPTGVQPHEVVLTPDQKEAYITNYGVKTYTQTEQGGDHITVVNLVTRKLDGDIPLPGYHRPHGIVLARSGKLYVTADFPPSLLVIDPVKRTILHRYDVGQNAPHMVAVLRDESKAYTANAASGTVTSIRLKGESPNKNLPVGGVPMGFTLSNDEKLLYATTRTHNTVAVIDTAKDEIVAEVSVPGEPVRAHLTPDGKTLLVTTIISGDLVAIDTQTRQITHRIHAGTHAEGLTISPDGEFAYVSAQDDHKVIRFSLKDWTKKQEIPTDERPDPVVVLGR